MVFVKTTNELSVKVEPHYLEEKSNPAERRHIFSYYITIENHSMVPVRLVRRHWTIQEEGIFPRSYEGEGNVGQQPIIPAGEEYRYKCYCVLSSYSGFMDGYYEIHTMNGEDFNVPIPRFGLRSSLLN